MECSSSMKKAGARALAITCAIALAAAVLLVITPTAAQALSAAKSDNAWRHNYFWYWSSPSESFLAQSNGNLERAEYTGDGLIVETYDSAYKLLNRKTIAESTYSMSKKGKDYELMWGGLLQGNDANWVVTGQSNDKEDNDLPVVRITKYDKSWNYIANVELCNKDIGYDSMGITEPFHAGGCSIVETDDELWVRTSRLMYTLESDGLRHQSNFEFVINKSTMNDNSGDEFYYSYVSHSFNQHQTVMGGKVYTLDHGDAYPRAIVLGSLFDSSYEAEVLKIKGATGDNLTYATTGGLAACASTGKLLSVGTSINQSTSSKSYQSNVWLAVTDTEMPEGNDAEPTTKFTWLTKSGDPSNPFIVQVEDEKFLVLWGDADANKVYYRFFDGNGKALGTVKSCKGALSDCQPIVSDGKVVWYVTTGTGPFFQSIDIKTGKASIDTRNYATTTKVGGVTYKLVGGVAQVTKASASKKSITIAKSVRFGILSAKVTALQDSAFSGTKVKAVMIKTGSLTQAGVAGCFKGSKVAVVFTPADKHSAYKKIFTKGNCGKKVSVVSGAQVKSLVAKGKKKAKLKVSRGAKSTRYQVAYKVSGKGWKYLKTKKTSVVLKKLASGKKVKVKVRAYKKVSGKVYYDSWSSTKSVKVK